MASVHEGSLMSLQDNILSCLDMTDVEPMVLRPLADVLGAESSVFLHFLSETGRPPLNRAIYAGDQPDVVETYARGYYEIDPVVAPSLDKIRRHDGCPSPETYLLRTAVEASDSQYYNEFLKPNGFGSIVVLTVPVGLCTAPELICLGFHRSIAAPAFGDAHRLLLQDVGRSVRAALGAVVYRQNLQVSSQIMKILMEQGNHFGLVILNDDLSVHEANKRGLMHLGLIGDDGEPIASRCRLAPLLPALIALDKINGGEHVSLDLRCLIGPDGNVEAKVAMYEEGRQKRYLIVTCVAAAAECLRQSYERYGLTIREIDIVQSLATGRANLNIAYQLNISLRTVENHLRSIYFKVGVNSRTQVLSKLMVLQ